MAQQKTPEALPQSLFVILRDSTTSVDIVLMKGKGGSLSMEGANVQVFSQFFEDAPAAKIPGPRGGTVMWEINGREFVSGDFYIGDSTGCIVMTKDGHEYVNRISETGNSFFRDQLNK
jgi:hypothetical protein